MASRSFSRRRVVQAGIGIGAAVAMARTEVRPAMADQPGVATGSAYRPPRYVPVSMALHTHSCFSEGGSFAAGGGGASMLAQLEQASRSNVDVVWWTDHDWRMEAFGYYDGIAFDGTDESGDLEWFVQNEGTVADA
ncbi:MAG TPA: hypothetical protein VE287_04980, partial [Actinopolymorphaceae bacterium]|nr:hypothetical protein [Actinopolymorphaceae bacterium]